MHLQKEISVDKWKRQVAVIGSHLNSVAVEDSWLKQANCFHLAAKFNPRGLHFLLDNLKDIDENLIQDLHKNGSKSPLHVAATNVDSLSTRYLNSNFSKIYQNQLF